MKTLKTLQQDYNGYKPKAGDEQKFKDKHVVKHSHKLSKATDDDDMFKAANVKVASRDPGHGYNAGEDEAVYEEKITHDVKAHTKAWLSGSDAPMDDDMGNYNKMHRLAKSHLSGGKVPAKDHSDLADKMVDHAELGEAVYEEAKADDKGLAAAHKKAQAVSKKEGVVQHIEKHPTSGHHSVSDWYDSDRTVASYNNGKLREEKITAKDVKMAVGVAKDKRYAGGNMTGASKVMDKIKPGLSKHPAAQKALRQANEEVELTLSESKEAKALYHQHHATVMDLLKKVSEGVKQHKAAIESDPARSKDNAYHYGHVGDMKNYKNQLEDMHQQITQMGEYAKPPMPMRMNEKVEPVVKRSLGKMMEAMMNKDPVGVKIHYTHPEKKPTHVTHFTAKDAGIGEKEMSSQGYKVKKRELVYGKAGA